VRSPQRSSASSHAGKSDSRIPTLQQVTLLIASRGRQQGIIAMGLIQGHGHAADRHIASVSGVTPIHRERMTDYEACAGAAKPENSSGDLLWTAKSPDWLISHDLPHCVWFLR